MTHLKLVWILTCISTIFAASMQNLRYKSSHQAPTAGKNYLSKFLEKSRADTKRYKRSSGTNCESWSTWVNNHTPTTIDKNDTESMTKSELDAFCPYAAGGIIKRMECKDDKGEPFSGIMKDRLHNYIIRCDNFSVGVVCTVNNSHWDRQCPDLSVRYFCTCDLRGITTIKVVAVTSSTTPTMQTTTATQATRSKTNYIRTTKSSMAASTKLPIKSAPVGDKTHAESSKDGGSIKIDSNFFFYSTVGMGAGILALIMMSCVITCLLCKRKDGTGEEEDKKKTRVRPF